jgi:signal transduction histidine kinase
MFLARRSSRRMLMSILAIVVIVPLSILLVMQYRYIQRLEKASVLVERDWIHGSAEELARTIEEEYRGNAERALDLQPAALENETFARAAVTRAAIPGANSFFVLRFGPPTSLYAMSPDGSAKCLIGDEARAVDLASASWAMVAKFRSVITERTLSVDERDHHHRVILRPVTDAASHVIGVAGVVLDENKAKQALSASIVKRVIAARFPGDTDVAVRFGPAAMFPAPSRRINTSDYITQPLAFIFTDWRVGVRDACATPEQMAAMNFRMNGIWSGLVALLLIAAIALAMHAIAREMRLSQMKSEFVSNVSHELRTPLASIRVFGEYMRLGRVTRPEKIREYGEYIETESRRLTQLINNILDVSRIESADKQYRFTECDAVDAVRQTVESFATPLRDRGIDVALRVPAEPLPLRIDLDAFGQVLVNLLDNAVKYSGGRGVSVSIDRDGGRARIAVSDRGIGIAPEEQKKIFEQFYRVGTALVHDVKGSGLGLAIVRHVVSAHGGTIEVSSVPGEGSTFTIVLPLHGAPASEPASAIASAANAWS